MKRETFYRCPVCGNMVVKVVDGGGKLVCCGKPMEVIEPNTTDAAQEKHVPVVTVEGDVLTANVGSVDHPMEEDHFIEWIYVVTQEGVLAKCLKPGEAPRAEFALGGQKPLSVFEFCNKHGLWKTQL
ncbi:MAG: desulfoferrodoxin FeS4 iron-binding domain-containing protein [Coriobacteriaceae bacterium]|nr:desulfoferrodoxin FeS4 iron-binding domain-containing protein [Coriobacteriaceae bacterium]